jgi:hypothetical protein
MRLRSGRRPLPVAKATKEPAKQKDETDGYVSKRFFIAVLHGCDWTKDDAALADGPFYFGQALRKITGQDFSDKQAVKGHGDLWVKFWKLSSSDVKINRKNPYDAIERYLSDAWVPSPDKARQFDSGGVCLWLDRKEESHMTMEKGGSSVLFSEVTKTIIQSEIEIMKVCMLCCFMFVNLYRVSRLSDYSGHAQRYGRSGC